VTVKASGTPTPAITETGALPTGVTLVDNANGTATLSGTPQPGTGGSYPIHLVATNVAGRDSETFVLTVDEAPSISGPATIGGKLHTPIGATFSATGYPRVSFDHSGSMPKGVTFGTRAGTATLGGTPTKAGTFRFTISASNGVSPKATQTVTVTIAP
jgi:hypothetical protein